jgi:hypothetical protein
LYRCRGEIRLVSFSVRDCVILGCGRSGTSLAAGVVARAGYNCGEDLLPADDGGPTGSSRRVG